MKRILVIIGHYLPGYKAGGPVRTIANLAEWLGDELQIQIVTVDRDMGDMQPYPGITQGSWQSVGKALVLYLPPSEFGLFAWRRWLNSLDYDLIYLNSFFARPTVETLFWRRTRQIPNKPLVLAPRGEFSPGALSLKRFKKRAYIATVQGLGLCSDILWQASSEYEMQDILAIFANNIRRERYSIIVAPNLPTKLFLAPIIQSRPVKQEGVARIIFLSRVARKKNLGFAIQLLAYAQGQVQFDIYGPLEDLSYWQECQALAAHLPSTIRVSYKSLVPPDCVAQVFAQYHLFFLPTLGENFGHVILEALCAGCMVLISDRTPWRGLAKAGVGWDLPLSEPEQFSGALNELITMDDSTFQTRSRLAQEYGRRFAEDATVVDANRQLFYTALAG